MLLSSLVVVLIAPAFARPTPAASAITFDPLLALRTTSKSGDIARAARAVDDAHHIQRLDQSRLEARSSFDGDGDDDRDVGWIIQRDISSNNYILAFSSASAKNLLELHASTSPADEDPYLVPLPTGFLPTNTTTPLPPNPAIENDETAPYPYIYSPYEAYLDMAKEAANALSLLLVSHAESQTSQPGLLYRLIQSTTSFFGLSPLLSQRKDSIPRPPRIEIAGHGLGAALALLSSTRMSSLNPDLTIRATLFSMPKIGDSAFADAVDQLVRCRDGNLEIKRVTYGRDPIPVLPPPHFGLVHPSAVQEVYLAPGDAGTKMGGRRRLEDSLGPYEGIIIGQSL